MPEIPSLAGAPACDGATMLLYIPQCFLTLSNVGQPRRKRQGKSIIELHRQGIGGVRSNQTFTLSWQQTFLLGATSTESTQILFAFNSTAQEGWRQNKKRSRLWRSISSTLPAFPEVFRVLWNHFSWKTIRSSFCCDIFLPLVTDWILIAWRRALPIICLATDWDAGEVCVFTSSRRFKVSGSTVPLDVKGCLWERGLIKANSTRRALVSGTVLLNNLFH